MKYDERGNIIETTFFGIDDKPCMSVKGYAKYTCKYDKRGNVIEESYFGIDGKLIISDKGYAKITRQYNDRGRITEKSYFDNKGNPCSFAKEIRKYDKRGCLVEKSFWGSDGRLRNEDLGYAKLMCTYDGRGNVFSETFWNSEEKRCMANYYNARYPYYNDPRYSDIDHFVTKDGRCETLENGYSRFEGKYDDRNKLTEVTYYDDKDNVILVIKNPEVVP